MNITKNLIIATVMITVIVVSILSLFVLNKGTTDVAPEGQNIDSSKQVNIVDDGSVLKSIGGVESYTFLSEDLYVFAKSAYPEYVDDDAVISFDIEDSAAIDNKYVVFKGKFGSINNLIDIRVLPLKNSRVYTSITDSETLLNADGYLPSNSKRNQYIGTLPQSSDSYSIDYNPENDGLIISLYPEDSAAIDSAYDEAVNSIKAGFGVSDIAYENIEVSRTSSSFGF